MVLGFCLVSVLCWKKSYRLEESPGKLGPEFAALDPVLLDGVGREPLEVAEFGGGL